jgi:hypothetical protein
VSYGWHRDGHVRAASGSSLGAAYTWPGLQRLSGLSYDPARDQIDVMLNPPLEEPSPRVVPTDALKPSPPPPLPARPVTVPPRAASGPAATPGPSAALEQVLNRLEQLRELERAENALRYEVQQLDEPHWGYLKLNPHRLEMSSHLGSARRSSERNRSRRRTGRSRPSFQNCDVAPRSSSSERRLSMRRSAGARRD